jgi:hypothetical protein
MLATTDRGSAGIALSSPHSAPRVNGTPEVDYRYLPGGRLAHAGDLYGALGLAAVFLAFPYLTGRLVMVWLIVNAEWHHSHAAEWPLAPDKSR